MCLSIHPAREVLIALLIFGVPNPFLTKGVWRPFFYLPFIENFFSLIGRPLAFKRGVTWLDS
jgi:hypothetical protein